MKKVAYSILLIISIVVVVSCVDDKLELSTRIAELEHSFVNPETGIIDTVVAGDLVRSYDAYAMRYKDDSLSPVYLQKAGQICMNTGKPMKAIEYFDRVVTDYPSYAKAGDCSFMKAFVLETEVKDLGAARKFYLDFLEKYPEHDFADDAQAMLQNLGKTPEELVAEFERRSDSLKN